MANKEERASLRIERHPRGHIASCNVPVESVSAKVEPCTSQYNPEDPRLLALMVEAQLHQKLHQQSLELEKFQKRVHERLKKQRYESCDKDLVVVEKHVPSLNEEGGVSSDKDHHDVVIVTGNNDRDRAFRKLLSLSKKADQLKDVPPLQNIPVNHVQRQPSVQNKREETDKIIPQSQTIPSIVQPKRSSCHISENELKLAEKKETATHHLAVRRMYSAIERQQSRISVHNKQQRVAAKKRRQLREEERRHIENLYLDHDEEESSDEKDRAQEWLEIVALERRHQKLAKQKELYRYCQALKHQLREKHPDLPPLCPCHASVWETDPMLCATNCQFHHNPTRFANELSSLLQSLTIS